MPPVYSDAWMKAVVDRGHALGIEVQKSSRADKKLMARRIGDSKWVHFGSRLGSDFLEHNDSRIRAAWYARHSAIKLADGSIAINHVMSPSWLSAKILW